MMGWGLGRLLRLGFVCCSGQLQLDCTPAPTGNSTQCYVAGQNTLQTCDAQPAGDPVKLPILMVCLPALSLSCLSLHPDTDSLRD